jgi:CspA family cold shock protein
LESFGSVSPVLTLPNPVVDCSLEQERPLLSPNHTSVMPQGTIKKIVSEKGFGFIATGGDDVFFHRSGVDGTFEDLREGDTVEFTEGQGPKGPCAENVKSL